MTTCTQYTNRVKVKYYGHNYLDDRGERGSSHFIWINEAEDGPLGEEELTILNQCAIEAYGPISPKIAMLDDAYHKGEITKAERDEGVGVLETMDSYARFVELVIQRLGFFPTKKTQLVDENNWNNK